jgi:hypothetical protein
MLKVAIFIIKIVLFLSINLMIYIQKKKNREIMKKWRYKNSNKYYGEKLSKLVDVIKFNKLYCKEYYHIPCNIDKE